MLTERIRALLRVNQLVVVIGARGTGKTHCANELERYWCELGLQVLRLDAGAAERPQDLEGPLADALGCDPTSLDARSLPGDVVLRVIVDRCDHLYDRGWLSELQERWRALLLDQESQGRLAAVFLGRPLFRQISGGDSSPLLNAGPVITSKPFGIEEIQSTFDVDEKCARAASRKTGGHPALTADFLKAIDCDSRKIGPVIQSFVDDYRQYVVRLIQDHPLGGRIILGELLDSPGPVRQGPLIRRHFGSAYADGVEAIDDLCASGLIERTSDGSCEIGAGLLKDISGIRGILSAPVFEPPSYSHEIMSEAWRVVYVAENSLRGLVVDSLTDLSPLWWMSHVPPEVRGAAEGRRKEEAGVLAIEDAQLHPVMYLTLGELFDLIFTRRNWSEVFRAVFPVGESAVREAAAQFSTVRNRLAHSRPLSEEQLGELCRAARRLGIGEVGLERAGSSR